MVLMTVGLFTLLNNGSLFFSWQMPVAIFIILVVAGLAWYIYSLHSAINVLEQVLNCIKCENYTVKISKRKKMLNSLLDNSVYNVIDVLRDRNNDLYEKLSYIENLMNNIDSALMVIDDKGEVHWSNRTACIELLGHDFVRISQLSILNEQMPDLLMNLTPGNVKEIKFERNGRVYEIAASMTHYRSKNHSLRLINLRNVQQILTKNENQTTQRIMSILTHEIMNSLSPIISLSEFLKEQIQDENSDKEEVTQGLSVIQRRSEGLLKFVNNYRKLSKLEPPVLRSVSLIHLLDEVRPLTHSLRSTITFPKQPPLNISLQIDSTQIVQVLLNLIKNADEACHGTTESLIRVGVEIFKEQVTIWVEDNGAGISKEALERIFIPFFTTKQQGSGIGLALCRQIMLSHYGNITVNSTQGHGSRFTLHFSVFEKE